MCVKDRGIPIKTPRTSELTNQSLATSWRRKAFPPPPRDNDGTETGDKEASTHNGEGSIMTAYALDNGGSCQKVKANGSLLIFLCVLFSSPGFLSLSLVPRVILVSVKKENWSREICNGMCCGFR